MTATTECVDCGRPVQRDQPVGAGYITDMLLSLPVICDECCSRQASEDAERESAEKAQAAAARIAAWRQASGVPEHLQSWRFDSITRPGGLQEALQAAARWATGDLNGLLLTGDNGVGKTRVAIAAANELLARRRVHWFSAPLLIARLGTGEFSNPHRVAALEALTGMCPLVLDDIDKARPTMYAAEALFVAVDQRADGGAPLLVTSNLVLAELAAQWPSPWGESIASRLMLLERVHVKGHDRRTAGTSSNVR